MILKVNDVLVFTDPTTGEVVRRANRAEVEGLRGLCRDSKGALVFEGAAKDARIEHFLEKRKTFRERILACEAEVKKLHPEYTFDDRDEIAVLAAQVKDLEATVEKHLEGKRKLAQLIDDMREQSERKVSALESQVKQFKESAKTVADIPAPKIEKVYVEVEKRVEVVQPCSCWWCRFMGVFK